ncbi:MAG TPA: hypothetical protein PLE99_10095 [Candidatus Thiothrix moscowensis]|uniref:hypothetical protein n=1 Tax=Thiothrix sp. UBA2016 TaxID=1947695 RepID=UPI0025F5D10B|nr:hypothetical protein [Thiothrix sp. UBA2016]HRJ53110.1 hypothetical protein [Candidatus Thiothrix moscowensis]HRJ93101.1 hypothetical protein [Candidatus Thiothrix moscowensis]
MSDYFTNLLARYQPETPVITPRLPSLFEPEQPVVGQVIPAFAVEAQGQEPTVQADDAGGKISLTPLFAKGEAGQHSVSQHRGKIKPPSFAKGGVGGGFSSSETDPRLPHSTVRPTAPYKPIPAVPIASSVPVQPASAPVVMPQTPVTSVVKPKDSPSIRQDDPVKPTATPKYQQRDMPETGQPPILPVIANVPVALPAAVPQQQQPPAAQPTPNINPTQSPVLPQTPRIEPRLLPAERSGIMTAPAIPAFSPPEPPPPQPEPVINVTIGRIEIRATVATSKQKPQAAARPPVMGLDEYLRQRGGKQP